MIVFYRLQSDSPNMKKISLMLRETGLSYMEKYPDRQDDGKFTDDFQAISPNGTFPVIRDEDNGVVVFESGAILYYLAEKSGRLLSTDIETRAETMKWLMFEAANMGPVMGELFHYLVKGTDEIAASHLQRYKDKVAKFCSILNVHLAQRDYLCGEYSIADVALYPWHVALEDMADVDLNDYPHLIKWAERINKHPAVIER